MYYFFCNENINVIETLSKGNFEQSKTFLKLAKFFHPTWPWKLRKLGLTLYPVVEVLFGLSLGLLR